MAQTDRDPVHAVRAFLAQAEPNAADPAALSPLTPQLREIYRRFDKVRQFHGGVGLSEALGRIMSSVGMPSD
jgi:hypothetical protein